MTEGQFCFEVVRIAREYEDIRELNSSDPAYCKFVELLGKLWGIVSSESSDMAEKAQEATEDIATVDSEDTDTEAQARVIGRVFNRALIEGDKNS